MYGGVSGVPSADYLPQWLLKHPDYDTDSKAPTFFLMLILLLSCVVFFCLLLWPCYVLYYLVLSSSFLFCCCYVLPCLALCCLTLSYLFLSCPILSSLVLSCRVVSCLVSLALSCLVLSYLCVVSVVRFCFGSFVIYLSLSSVVKTVYICQRAVCNSSEERTRKTDRRRYKSDREGQTVWVRIRVIRFRVTRVIRVRVRVWRWVLIVKRTINIDSFNDITPTNIPKSPSLTPNPLPNPFLDPNPSQP